MPGMSCTKPNQWLVQGCARGGQDLLALLVCTNLDIDVNPNWSIPACLLHFSDYYLVDWACSTGLRVSWSRCDCSQFLLLTWRKEGNITFSLLSGGLGLQHWTENDNISELNISWEVSWFSQRRVEHGNFIDILTWGWAGPDVTNHLRPDQQPPSGLLWPNEHFSTA